MVPPGRCVSSPWSLWWQECHRRWPMASVRPPTPSLYSTSSGEQGDEVDYCARGPPPPRGPGKLVTQGVDPGHTDIAKWKRTLSFMFSMVKSVFPYNTEIRFACTKAYFLRRCFVFKQRGACLWNHYFSNQPLALTWLYLRGRSSELGDSKAHVLVSSSPFCCYHFHYVVTYWKWPSFPCPYSAPSKSGTFIAILSASSSWCTLHPRQATTDTCMMDLQYPSFLIWIFKYFVDVHVFEMLYTCWWIHATSYPMIICI